MDRSQTKAQNLQHGQLADSVLRSRQIEYEPRQYSAELPVFMEVEGNSKLPPALQDVGLEFGASSLGASLRSSSTPVGHRAGLFFTVKEVRFLRETFLLCKAYLYTKERMLDSPDESGFWMTAEGRYEQGLRTAFLAEQTAQSAYQGHGLLPRFRNSAQSAGKLLKTLDYPRALP